MANATEITLTDINRRLGQFSDDTIKHLLALFNAGSVREIRPSDYPAFMDVTSAVKQ